MTSVEHFILNTELRHPVVNFDTQGSQLSDFEKEQIQTITGFF